MAKLKKLIAQKVAVIGAGWAGCAAAVTLSRQGHQVTLIEASRTLGGRARKVDMHGSTLDNGQHILLGAYTACLGLLRTLKVEQKQAFLRLPLQMVYPHQTGMQFIAPSLPAPLHLFFALIKAQGLERADKMALARFSTTARWMDWQLNQDCTVSELLQRYEQTDKLCRLMWNPLCIAALNTPPERASAQVFLNVLRDSLGAKRAASDMLIPRLDLSRLLPDIAAKFVTEHQGQVITGLSIQSIELQENRTWRLHELHQHQSISTEFDSIIIATSAEQCKRLIASMQNANQESDVPVSFDAEFSYEPITTCYLQYPASMRLSRPFFALADQPEQNYWGQFIFDRGQLNTQQAGLMAVVISASGNAIAQSHEQLALAICNQLTTQLQTPELATPVWSQIITEKRATFTCAPDLKRPTNSTTIDSLLIAGDYTACDYPATLEAAVRSGILAAQSVPKFKT
ncbi:MAG: hydroxysqualene dehydroxylase HpnE [Candidatus Aquirickettsiella gammari]